MSGGNSVLVALLALLLLGALLAVPEMMPKGELEDVSVSRRAGWTEVTGYLAVPDGAMPYDWVTISAAWRGPDGRIVDRSSDLLRDVGPGQRRYWRVLTNAPDAIGVDLSCIARDIGSTTERAYCAELRLRDLQRQEVTATWR